MPTYGYECAACKEKFEVVQKITEDSLKVHEGCGGSLKRLLYPVGIVFKGSGFYVNDYANAGKKEKAEKPAENKSETKSEGGEAKSETKTESKPETKTETKTESKPAAPVASKTD
jgi:putative FmdB family regulatory protein